MAPMGFVGVGNMGAAMAARAVSVGREVVAFDPSPAACARMRDVGVKTLATAAAVAAECDVVSIVVNTGAQFREAMLGSGGILAGAQRGLIVAVHSTIHVTTLEEVAATAADRGVTVCDAAVTGGPDAAVRGELAIMVGGNAEAVGKLMPDLSTYGSVVVRIGDLGAGMAAKISLMVISLGKVAAAYEGLLLARSAGVDLSEFVRIVGHSEKQSGLHEFFLRERANLFADPAALLGPIGVHEAPKSRKDLDAAIELGRRCGIELPVTSTAHDAMDSTWGVN